MANHNDPASQDGQPPAPQRERGPGQAVPGGEKASSGRPAPRPHPRPPLDAVHVRSLNDAVRRELWYLDSIVAAPFRLARRYVRSKTPKGEASPLRMGADELLWAVEGLARLPLKLLQAAAGEPPPAGGGSSPS